MKNLIIILSIVALISCSDNNKKEMVSEIKDTSTIEKSQITQKNEEMYPKLSNYIKSILPELENIPNERKNQLKKIALFIRSKKQSNEPANLTFICTHNSRRSHMSQIWSSTAAAYYDIEEGIQTYSGGTEVTAFNPRAVEALKRAGFKSENSKGENPSYKITFSDAGHEMECFSKKYDHPNNPSENFVAIMTCSEADKNCPFIPGASLRIPIPYQDPKEADGTSQEETAYDKRCRQIASEMFYIMSQVKA